MPALIAMTRTCWEVDEEAAKNMEVMEQEVNPKARPSLVSTFSFLRFLSLNPRNYKTITQRESPCLPGDRPMLQWCLRMKIERNIVVASWFMRLFGSMMLAWNVFRNALFAFRPHRSNKSR